MGNFRLVTCSVVPAIIAFSSLAATPMDYVGQYVLRLGEKNFIVLNLRTVQGLLTGDLSRPRRASFGTAFYSNIGSEIVVEPITSATLQHDHLHVVAKDPKDASTDAFDLTLVAADSASLQATDIPVDPWILARVPISPALSVASDWDPHRAYYIDDTGQSNPDMQRLIDEDQKPRQSTDMSHADWATINKQDEERRKQVRELLSRGVLHTGKDFEEAAFIFQHGGTPDDYLLAHTLAMIAVARGNSGALWIATATLDRYLNSIKQPQIYGTQFHFDKDTPWTQEPYNRTLLSDDLRRQLGVPSQAAQQKQLKEYKSANQR
jgi:hypothetical protein